MPRLINVHRLHKEPLSVFRSRLECILKESQAEGSLDLVSFCKHGVFFEYLLVRLIILLVLLKKRGLSNIVGDLITTDQLIIFISIENRRFRYRVDTACCTTLTSRRVAKEVCQLHLLLGSLLSLFFLSLLALKLFFLELFIALLLFSQLLSLLFGFFFLLLFLETLIFDLLSFLLFLDPLAFFCIFTLNSLLLPGLLFGKTFLLLSEALLLLGLLTQTLLGLPLHLLVLAFALYGILSFLLLSETLFFFGNFFIFSFLFLKLNLSTLFFLFLEAQSLLHGLGLKLGTSLFALLL